MLYKVKGHDKVRDGMTSQEKAQVIGNDLADVYAKKGAKANNYTIQMEEEVARAKRSWKQAAKLMTSTLALWPPSKEVWGVLQKEVGPRRVKQRRAGSSHDWLWDGMKWRCKGCHTASWRRKSRPDRPCAPVGGTVKRMIIQDLEAEELGGQQQGGAWR